MSKALLIFLLIGMSFQLSAETRTIHVMVALCDNEVQSIVPVSGPEGDGRNATSNLYWGGILGFKTVFDKLDDWQLVKELPCDRSLILKRVLYKHRDQDVYLLADAYNGKKIKVATYHYLHFLNGQLPKLVKHDTLELGFGGASDMVAYLGHNGLLDFKVKISYKTMQANQHKAVLLAPDSREMFFKDLRKAGAFPLIWTKMLMEPDAWTLSTILEGWIYGETGEQIRNRAVGMYNQIHRCGIYRAKDIFATGMSDGH